MSGPDEHQTTPRGRLRRTSVGAVAAVALTAGVWAGATVASAPGAAAATVQHGATTARTAAATVLHGTTTARTAASTGTYDVKPIIRGLVDRQGEPPKLALPYVHAYVIAVNWADLQPSAYGPIVANNAIDAAIARVRQSDYAAQGMVLKLRVYAGLGAPTWAKSLGGAPIPYRETVDDTGEVGTIGRFWTAPFESAWADFQRQLALRYDAVPEIREVTVSGCTTIYDEPFVRQPGVPANVTRLAAAGYTTLADQGCIRAAVAAQNVWQHTTSDLDVSPFPNALAPLAPHDMTFPIATMHYCRDTLGVRCGLQNNALSYRKLNNPNFRLLYNQMSTLGSPIAFQTAAMIRLGDPWLVMHAAISMGTNSVELPRGYEHWSTALLTWISTAVSANAAR